MERDGVILECLDVWNVHTSSAVQKQQGRYTGENKHTPDHLSKQKSLAKPGESKRKEMTSM